MKGRVRRRKNNAWSYRINLGVVDGKRKQVCVKASALR